MHAANIVRCVMTPIPQLAVVPLKPFADAKLRLRDAMSSERRQALAYRMATHVVTTSLQVLPTGVVSRDHDVLHLAESLGAYPIPERTRVGLRVGGLNDALGDAVDWARARDTKALVVIAGDLPFLRPDDVTALLRFPGRPGIVIAPDRARSGTNALALMPPDAAEFRFGPDSLHRHRRSAYLAGVPVRTTVRLGLSRDIDTPADLDIANESAGLSVIDRMLFQPDVSMTSLPHERAGVDTLEQSRETRAAQTGTEGASETAAPDEGRMGRLGKRRRKTGGTT